MAIPTEEMWEYAEGLDGASDSLKKFLADETIGAKTLENYTEYLKKQEGGFKALKSTAISVGKSIASFGLNLLIDIGITALMEAITAPARIAEEQAEKAKEAMAEEVETARQTAEESRNIADSWADLSLQIQKTEGNMDSITEAFTKQALAMGKTREEIEKLLL